MGGSSGKQAQLDRYGQLLSPSEKKALSDCFVAIAGRPEADSFTEDQLEAYLSGAQFSLPKDVISGLFVALGSGGARRDTAASGQVTFPSFVQNGSQLLRGSITQKAELLHRVCGGGCVSLERVESTVLSFLRAILTGKYAGDVFPESKHWAASDESAQRLSSYLTIPLKEKLAETEKEGASDYELESWLSSQSGLALRILEAGLACCLLREAGPTGTRTHLGLDASTGEDNSADRSLLPVKTQHPLYRETFGSTLLDRSSLMLLNAYVPSEVRGSLYPLFSSVEHGQSFSTFCKQLVDKGPTLVVVRDTGGHVFGGFAGESWQFHPQFTGNTTCFLFSLVPEVGVYTPTGYNDNFMYLQQNAQTLPNGMGMGGQMEYFGLWLSADYGRGHSKARPKCSTYGSPVLASREEFEVDTLEVWGVGTPALPDKGADGSAPSILDKDKTATALLEMAGKTIHSAGLREPAESGETEEA